MNSALFRLYFKIQDLMQREEGQDLVEYGLIIALIAVATVTTMRGIATNLNTVFTNIANSLVQ